MTKYIHSVLLLVFLISSCANAIKDEPTSDKETPEKVVEEIVEPVHYGVTKNKTIHEQQDIYGFWVGWFEPDDTVANYDRKGTVYMGEHRPWFRENKITISIDTMRDDSVIGHSIVAGNLRRFAGTYSKTKNKFTFNVSEPGDHKYDGAFKYSIELNGRKLNGTWKANKKIEIPKRKYSLEKKHFEYYPKNIIRDDFADWMKTKNIKGSYDGFDDLEEMEAYFATTNKVTELNPSVDVLTQEQVEKLTKADIYILRNSIYAKHGYSFKKRALRVFFDSHDWYMPVHVNIKRELTDIEKQNIKLLLRYEKYAEEYYDEFGRG